MDCPSGKPIHRTCTRSRRGCDRRRQPTVAVRSRGTDPCPAVEFTSDSTRSVGQDSFSFLPITKRNSGIPIMRKFAHKQEANWRKPGNFCLFEPVSPKFFAKTGSPIIKMLGTRLRRGQQFYSDVINALRARTKNLISC